jgi:hypothetical protein
MASQTTGSGNSGIAAGLAQPQTTVEAPGGPFIRHSQPGRRPQYNLTGLAFGGQTTQPLVSAPGYARGFRLKFTATGGVGTGVAAQPDAPFNLAALVQLKDAYSTPLIVAPGYQAFYLIAKYGGAFGRQSTRDITNLPSYSAIASTSGNFSFSTQLPLEFTKGYGVISMANASLLPTLSLNYNSSAALYSGTVTTPPSFALENDLDFYWLPEGVNIAPPGLGTTRQFAYQQCLQSIGSTASTTTQVPRMGGYLDTLTFELRDSTGARVDAWPTRPRFYVDGVPLIDSDITEIYDDMAIQYEGTSRPTGVISISRKTSLSQIDEGLLDTGETFLSTNPGTLLEMQGAPWGAITNSPATLNVLFGQVVPSGALIQGLSQQ